MYLEEENIKIMDKKSKIALIIMSVAIGLVGAYAIVQDIVKRTCPECEEVNVDEIRQNALKDGMLDIVNVIMAGNVLEVEGGVITFIPFED